MRLRIVVVSDSHGHTDLLARVISECAPFDIIVHCGDGIKDICMAPVPDKSTILKVMGNTDMYSGCEADNILTEKILDKTVMVAHGHQFGVKGGLKRLSDEGHFFEAAVVLFGHTHEQTLHKGSPLLFNPGNLSGGGYGIIHAEKNKDWLFEHKRLKRG